MNFIAWWGAGLSTFLALIKIWELWQSRFRIDVGYNFKSLVEEGNQVFIRNLTSHPVIVEHWELLLGKGLFPFRGYEPLVLPGAYSEDFRIEAHTSAALTFRGGDHFSWSEKFLKGRKIYLRVIVAGRRPITKLVYGS